MGQTIREAATQVAQPAPAAPAEDPKKKVRGYATRSANILTSGQGLASDIATKKKNLLGG